LRNIAVPLFLPEKMKTLGQDLQRKVTQAYLAEKTATRMLEIAKRGVEIAIEQDEAAALAWMKEQGA
jgi:hypothetical protein